MSGTETRWEPCYGCRHGLPIDAAGVHYGAERVTFGGPCPNRTPSDPLVEKATEPAEGNRRE